MLRLPGQPRSSVARRCCGQAVWLGDHQHITREGMAIARSRGKLRGKQPKLSDKQQKELRRMHDTGDYSITDLAELFSISRPTFIARSLGRFWAVCLRPV